MFRKTETFADVRQHHREHDVGARSMAFFGCIERARARGHSHKLAHTPDRYSDRASCTHGKASRVHATYALQMSKSSRPCALLLLHAAFYRVQSATPARGGKCSQEQRRQLRSPTCSSAAGHAMRHMAALERFRRGLAVSSGGKRVVVDGTHAQGLAGSAVDRRGACGMHDRARYVKVTDRGSPTRGTSLCCLGESVDL